MQHHMKRTLKVIMVLRLCKINVCSFMWFYAALSFHQMFPEYYYEFRRLKLIITQLFEMPGRQLVSLKWQNNND